MKNLLIFDYDGVIADSLNIMWECFKRIDKKYDFFHFKNKNEVTKIWDQNLFESASKFGVSTGDFGDFYKEWTNLLRSKNKKVEPFAGLKSVLEKLSQNNYLVIISSNEYGVISDFLKRSRLFNLFDLIFGAEKGKSKTRKLGLVLNKFKIPKNRVYFITDTIGDLKELKGAGIKIIAVTWGYHNKEKLQNGEPDFLVENPIDLLGLFL